METVSVKFEESFLKDIEQAMKEHRYMTKTEFIREAVREKLTALEKVELLQHIERTKGMFKHRHTTDEDLHRTGEHVFERLERDMLKRSRLVGKER